MASQEARGGFSEVVLRTRARGFAAAVTTGVVVDGLHYSVLRGGASQVLCSHTHSRRRAVPIHNMNLRRLYVPGGGGLLSPNFLRVILDLYP